MTIAGGHEWRGPYESRAVFEAFQDNCIAQLVQFALHRPLFTDNPEQLQHQLWRMGKYAPAAFLGLGRYNPSVCSLIIYGGGSNHDFSTGKSHINTHLHLDGEDAYEQMVNSWHDYESWSNNHRFDVQSVRETPHNLHAILWAKKASLIGYWNFNHELQICCIESVDVPNTSYTNDINAIEWTHLSASAGDGDYRTRQGYYAAPFDEPAQQSRVEKLSTTVIAELAGEAALHAFETYGEVGLYQERLWSRVRQLLAGLFVGPNVNL